MTIRLKHIYNFLYSMLLYTPFALCFVTLCGIFMHFPAYFLLFLCFRKATQEIFLELDRTKAEPPIFPKARQSPKMRRKGSRGQPHPRVAWPRPWPHHQGVRPPGPPPDAALPPIYSPRREKPNTQSIFHETYYKPPPSSTRDQEGLEALPSTLPEAFSTTMVTSGVMCE
jgi:hypothetical protein